MLFILFQLCPDALGCEFVRRSAKCEVEFAQIIAIIWINLTSSLRQKSLGRSKSRRTWAVELTRSEVTKWFYRVFVPKVAVCKILPIGIHTSNFWSPKLEVSFHENPSDRINDQISTAGILAFSQIIRLGAWDLIEQTHSLSLLWRHILFEVGRQQYEMSLRMHCMNPCCLFVCV